MKLNVNFNRKISKPEFSEDAVEARKAISLLYLEEALYKEQYEDCAGLIVAAKGFGAEQGEISKVIAKYLKTKRYGFVDRSLPKQPKRNEANEPNLGGRRF